MYRLHKWNRKPMMSKERKGKANRRYSTSSFSVDCDNIIRIMPSYKKGYVSIFHFKCRAFCFFSCRAGRKECDFLCDMFFLLSCVHFKRFRKCGEKVLYALGVKGQKVYEIFVGSRWWWWCGYFWCCFWKLCFSTNNILCWSNKYAFGLTEMNIFSDSKCFRKMPRKY